MRTRLLAVLAALFMAVAGAVAFSAPASAAPISSDQGGPVLTPNLCNDTAHHNRDGRIGHFFGSNTGVNIRTGPGLNCASRGQGQPGHLVTLWCWTNNGTSFTWSFLVDHTTGVSGWVRDDLLAGFGANAHC